MAKTDPIALTASVLQEPPLPSAGKRLNIWDSASARGGVKGLCLRVTPTGSASWYCTYKQGGRLVWFKLRAARDADGTVRTTLSSARAFAKEHMAKVAAGADPRAERDEARAKQRGVGTLEKVLEQYVTDHLAHTRSGAETERRIRQVFAELLEHHIDAISELDIVRVRRARLRKVAPQSWNRDYAGLRALYSWAMQHGHSTGCPLKPHHKVGAVDDSRVRWLGQRDPEEEGRFLAALEEQPAHVRMLVRLAMWTGCRRGELFDLTWGAVDLVRAQLTVEAHTAKSTRKRVVPLPAPAVAMLRGRKPEKAKSDALVVPSPVNGARLVTIKKSWAALCREAQVEDFRFHDLRHHYASKLVMGGADVFTVSKLLGHADPQITSDRYAHLSDRHKADAVARVFG